MNQKAASLNFERKRFLVPFCLGILIATYGLMRLGHGPFPFGATRVLRILGGITIAIVSWFLSSRRRTADLNFERKLFLVPFCMGILIAVYALLRLGHGPSPFASTRVLKIVAGSTIAAMSWFLSSRRGVQSFQNWFSSSRRGVRNAQDWLERRIKPVVFKVGEHTHISKKQRTVVEFLSVTGEPTPQQNLKRTFLFWLAFSAGLLWLGPFSNYSAPGSLDPWIYTGYFTNFHELVNRFGLFYYPTRLPYVMFGVLMYKIFAPLAANYLINVTLLSIDTFSLYAILSRYTEGAVALVTTVAMACNAYLISTIAWDYPDGPAITFLLLGFWMVLAPPRQLKGGLATIFAGAFWAMAGYTNLIAGLIIIPGVLILFYVRRVNLREATKQCAWLAVGVAVVTIFFGFVSLQALHTFAFWKQQWMLYRYATTTKGLLAGEWGTGWSWILSSYRLAMTYGLTVIGVIFFVRHFRQLKKDQFFLTALLLLVLSDLIFAYVEVGMNAVVLRVSYTSSYLIAPVFIFFGALLSALGKIQEEGRMAGFKVVPMVVVLAGVILPLFSVHSLSRWLRLPQNDWLMLAALGVVGLIAISLPGNTRRFGIIVAAFCFALLISLSTSLNLYAYALLNPRQEFKAAMATQNVLTAGILQDRPMIMWYDNNEQWSPLYDSIYSLYLWGNHDLTHELPTMPAQDLRDLVHPDTVIIHLTRVPAKMPERVRLLATRNIRVEDIGHWRVQRGNIEFEVFAQHVLNASELK